MLSLRVDGKIYEGFDFVNVYKSLGDISNYFSFTATNNPAIFPIRNGAFVEVLIDNENLLVSGFIRRLRSDYNIDGHTVTLEGYSILQDLVDSSLPTKDYEGPITLQNLIKRVLKDLNMSYIKIINNAGTIKEFGEEETISAEQEQSAYDFLEKMGRKRQVFYKTSMSGNLEIIGGYDGELNGILLSEIGNNNNNILKSEYKSDKTNLFNTYKIFTSLKSSNVNINKILKKISSVTNSSEKVEDVDSINIVAQPIIDNNIRNSRYKEIIAEENIEEADLQNRLKWEVSLRYATSEEYNATIQGHMLGSEMLDTNKLIRVKDDAHGLDRKFLIKSIEYRYSFDSGSTTTISCTHKDAYKAELMTYVDDDNDNVFNSIYKSIVDTITDTGSE